MASAFLGSDGLLIGTIVPFIIVLTIVVFVHEIGHYLVGRACGIGVKAFSIGFGPELLGFNDRHGTRWRISAIPLGGYVKFLGDISVTSSEPDDEELERLSPQERAHAFHTQPVWKRALTVFAGPAFNFLFTIVVFAAMFITLGRYVAEPTVAEVRPDSPAAIAGFEPGDRFLSVDGTPVTTFSDLQRYISPRSGDEISFVVLRDGKELEIRATPETYEETDPLGNQVKRGIIGVSTTEEVSQGRREELTVGQSIVSAIGETGYVIQATGQFFKRFVTGREDRCQLGGPVKIADMAGKAAQKGYDWLIQLVALLSVGIGILNLLPIPPLDGGHLLFYAVEAIQRRPLSEKVLGVIHQAGFMVVLAFMGFVFWNDLFGC
ncbi:MAG: RIP metalloprotease RseP [Notoacmeibacter sp.]|nr:RIP metalloprotease RseP [Notoacmeibacter sp.]